MASVEATPIDELQGSVTTLPFGEIDFRRPFQNFQTFIFQNSTESKWKF